MTPTDLDDLYLLLFGWITREVVVGMYAAVGLTLLALGLVLVCIQPRALGVLLCAIAVPGIGTHTWLWHTMTNTQTDPTRILAAVSLTATTMALVVMRAAFVPAARESGQGWPLAVISGGLTLLAAVHLNALMDWLLAGGPPSLAWYYWRFVPALMLLAGVACSGAGAIAGLVMRACTKLPPRSLDQKENEA